MHGLCWGVLDVVSPQRAELMGLDLSLQKGLWTPGEASPVRIAGISVCVLASVCPQGWTHPGGLFVIAWTRLARSSVIGELRLASAVLLC